MFSRFLSSGYSHSTQQESPSTSSKDSDDLDGSSTQKSLSFPTTKDRFTFSCLNACSGSSSVEGSRERFLLDVPDTEGDRDKLTEGDRDEFVEGDWLRCTSR